MSYSDTGANGGGYGVTPSGHFTRHKTSPSYARDLTEPNIPRLVLEIEARVSPVSFVRFPFLHGWGGNTFSPECGAGAIEFINSGEAGEFIIAGPPRAEPG